ncbi:N-6 DNA methylase [Cryobacterium sp. M15]|uniref:N-6 DNA methylase n=1 Tax=Cryobacterium sp. M15 TaxID=2048291 RepID=UPI000CE3282A|nr:N-6 DNA methylase [Cryobacterium sp. M15]
MPSDASKAITQALKAFATDLKVKLNSPGSPDAWPEDQLKAPLENLLKAVGQVLGVVVVVRTEAPRPADIGDVDGGARVDAAVSVGSAAGTTLLTGHVELKAPGKGGDPSKLRGARDKTQWTKFKKLPNLIYTDGQEWSLQRTGTRSGRIIKMTGDPVAVGADAVTELDGEKFELLFRSFLTWAPIVPTSSKQIADLLAPLCRLLRTEAKAALDTEGSALGALAMEWRKYLFPGASNEVVADAYAQTFTYALLIARFEGANPLTVEKAEEVLNDGHGLLGEVLGLLNNPSAHNEVRTSTDLILRVVEQVKPSAITKRNAENPRLYFYEEFLAAYDPGLRKNVGAYYTPAEVVRAQTNIVRSLLIDKFGKPAGFAHPDVVTLDPAVGTGTYPLGILESVARDVPANAPAALPERLRQAVKNLYGIEYLIGPYSVAHLRLSRFLDDHGVTAPEGEELLNILLADTLASHERSDQLMLPDVFGYEHISQEREEARELKVDTRVVVCMGNPPYLRGRKTDAENGTGSGGWVTMRREPIKNAKVRDPVTGRKVNDRGEIGIIRDFIAPAVAAGRGGDVKNSITHTCTSGVGRCGKFSSKIFQ